MVVLLVVGVRVRKALGGPGKTCGQRPDLAPLGRAGSPFQRRPHDLLDAPDIEELRRVLTAMARSTIKFLKQQGQ
jgi:hypothetical protein